MAEDDAVDMLELVDESPDHEPPNQFTEAELDIAIEKALTKLRDNDVYEDVAAEEATGKKLISK
eukprot:9999296-Karenia_brevis.AAC.1